MSRKIQVEIVGDASSLERAFGRSSAATNSFGSSLGKLAKIATGALGLYEVTRGVESVMRAAMGAQASSARLDVAFKNVGLSSAKAAKQIDETEKAGRKLGFTNTQTKQSLGSLITSTGDVTKSVREYGIAQDLARFKGIDLETATKALTMANAGSMRAIKQLGITITPVTTNVDALRNAHVKLTTEQGRAELAAAKLRDKQATIASVMDIVSGKVRGQADAFSKTGAGAVQVFQANLEGLEESIGAKFLPMLTRAVSFVNAHWPEISRVADQVGQAIQTGIGAATDFVQQHWETIKTIGVGAFNALKTAAETLGGFLKTGFGQSAALAIVPLYGMVKAVKAVSSAVGALKTLSFAGSPVLAGLAVLSAAIGLVGKAFIDVAIDTARANSAFRDMMGTINALKGIVPGIHGAQRDLLQTEIQLGTATDTLKQKTAAWHTVLSEGKQHTQAGIVAWREMKQAQVDVGTQTDAVNAAHTRLNATLAKSDATNKTLHASLADLNKRYDALLTNLGPLGQGTTSLMGTISGLASTVRHPIAAFEGLSRSMNFGKNIGRAEEQLGRVGGAAMRMAANLQASDPKTAESAIKLSRLAFATQDLMIKYNKSAREIGSKKIQAEVARLKTAGFLADLERIVLKARDAGEKSHTGFFAGAAKIVQAAASKVSQGVGKVAAAASAAHGAGSRVGAAAGQGIADGIGSKLGAIVAAAVSTVRTAMAAAGAMAHGSGPWQFTRHAVGHPLMEGVAEGIVERMGLVAAAFRRGVKDPLDDPAVKAEIIAASRVLGAGAVKGITDGILGRQESMKQQLIKGMRDAVKQAMDAARQEVLNGRTGLETAIQSVVSNVMSAVGSLGANFGTKKTRDLGAKLTAEQQALADQQLAEQRAANDKAITDAQAKKQADVEAGADAQTIAADEAAIAAAIQAKADFEAQKQIEADQKALAEAQKRDKDNLEKQLAALQNEIKAHPERAKAIKAEIDKLLEKYGITPASVTAATDWQTAQTLFVQSIGNLVQGMKDLKGALDNLASKTGGSSSSPSVPPGGMPAKAAGGFLGGSEGQAFPILAHANEYVLRSSATRKIGIPALNYMNKTGRLPMFADGGPVTSARRPDWASDIAWQYWLDKQTMTKMVHQEANRWAKDTLTNPSSLPTPVSAADATIDAHLAAMGFGGRTVDPNLSAGLGELKALLDQEGFRGLRNWKWPSARMLGPNSQYLGGVGGGGRGPLPFPISRLATGGTLLSDGLFYGHQGERVTPAKTAPLGRDGPAEFHIYIDGEKVEKVVTDRQIRNGRYGRPGFPPSVR